MLVLIMSVILSGCVSNSENIDVSRMSLSKNISPEFRIYVTDKYQNNITRIESIEYFFPQQAGLPEGTMYGFRLLKDSEVIIPLKDVFIAGRNKWEVGSQPFHGIPPGDYVIELVKIENGTGTIVAQTGFSTYTRESRLEDWNRKMNEKCGQILDKVSGSLPQNEFDLMMRDLGRCVADIAVEERNPEVCTLLANRNKSDERCYIEYGIKSGDTSVCNRLGMPELVGYCRAVVMDDPSQCENIKCDFTCAFEPLENQIAVCLMMLASEKQDVMICDRIAVADIKDKCKSLFR
jgi:hypothetical protein